MNIDCDEGSAKNCPPRLGMFKYRGLSTDMPEVVPFLFLMAWKQAMQPSEKTADLCRIIARLKPEGDSVACKVIRFLDRVAIDQSSLAS
jgi:hypothetical protein